MAKVYAEAFYKSKAWQKTRESYMHSVNGLCENCLRKGLYEPAVIVHHKEHITRTNIENPEVTLSFGNLMAVCRKCHAAEHDEMYGNKLERKNKKRFSVDGFGTVTVEK